jgi:LPXTG-motif cell wall-anchored protein
MKKIELFIILALSYFFLVSCVGAKGLVCNITEDCYQFYKSSAYTCESVQEENGSFCQATKDCEAWQFEKCEKDFTVWKNNCSDEKKEECLGCKEINLEKQELCQFIGETGQKSCRIVAGGLGYQCSDQPPGMAADEKNLMEDDIVNPAHLFLLIGLSMILLLGLLWWKFRKNR